MSRKLKRKIASDIMCAGAVVVGLLAFAWAISWVAEVI